MALGAQRGDILWLAVSEGMRLVAIGLSLGLIGSFVVMSRIANLLYDVRPIDPAAFLAITILLAVVAFIAACIPARRATTTDPMTVLRTD